MFDLQFCGGLKNSSDFSPITVNDVFFISTLHPFTMEFPQQNQLTLQLQCSTIVQGTIKSFNLRGTCFQMLIATQFFKSSQPEDHKQPRSRTNNIARNQQLCSHRISIKSCQKLFHQFISPGET